MKTVHLFIILNCLVLKLAYSQNWSWAKSAGGTFHDGSDLQLLSLDGSGNAYFAGKYYSNPCYFVSDTLTPNGLYDFFVAKYDFNGNEIWVKGFGGNNTTAMQEEGIYSINYSSADNSIIVSGSFFGTIIFGNDTLVGNPNGGFIIALDTNGNYKWVKRCRGALTTVDEDGNIYAQFYISSPELIDSFPAGEGIWLAKFTSQGILLNARKIFNLNTGTAGYDALLAKFRVKNGKLYGVGSCTVNSFIVDSTVVNAIAHQYIITCFDTSGSLLWIKPCSGVNSHFISDIVVDNVNNSYITGPFNYSAIFDHDTLITNSQDLFIAKYDSSGNNIWTRQGYSSHASSFNLALDNASSIYLIGLTNDSVITCGDTLIASANFGKSFIIKFDTGATCITSISYPSDIGLTAVACNANGEVYVTGSFGNTINLNGISLTSNGLANIFIAKCDAITGIEDDKRKSNQLVIYANPNKGTCSITIPEEFRHQKNLVLSVFDNTGKPVQQGTVDMSEEKVRINLQAEASGIYNVTLSNGRKSYAGKIVFE